jgi:diguanylate cyclase
VNERRILTIVGAASLAVAALYVGRAAAADTALYRGLLTDAVLLRAAAVCKLALLALACRHAAQTFRRLEPGNDARLPWLLLALALGGFTLGQAVLSGYQLATGESPFPSPADAFFIAAYPPLLAAFVRFGRAYRRSGLPVGPVWQHLAIAAGVVASGALLAGPLLRPILAAPGTRLEHALNVLYPAFDLALLVPLAILVRITWPFRGGAVFRAWALLLGGIVCMCAGDLLFAWFSTLDVSHFDPLLHAAYLVGYVCLAAGTRLHRDLVG